MAMRMCRWICNISRGFDESLLTYNQRTEAIRFGIAIVR